MIIITMLMSTTATATATRSTIVITTPVIHHIHSIEIGADPILLPAAVLSFVVGSCFEHVLTFQARVRRFNAVLKYCVYAVVTVPFTTHFIM